MKPETRYRLRAFLWYLIIGPFYSKVSMPNLKFVTWVLIFCSILFRNKLISISLLFLALVFYLIQDYKTGNFVYQYRNRKKEYKEHREALVEVRKLKKENNETRIEEVVQE